MMKYSKNDLIEFEKEIAELYNNAKIKAQSIYQVITKHN